jgi:hypothetical protein
MQSAAGSATRRCERSVARHSGGPGCRPPRPDCHEIRSNYPVDAAWTHMHARPWRLCDRRLGSSVSMALDSRPTRGCVVLGRPDSWKTCHPPRPVHLHPMVRRRPSDEAACGYACPRWIMRHGERAVKERAWRERRDGDWRRRRWRASLRRRSATRGLAERSRTPRHMGVISCLIRPKVPSHPDADVDPLSNLRQQGVGQSRRVQATRRSGRAARVPRGGIGPVTATTSRPRGQIGHRRRRRCQEDPIAKP